MNELISETKLQGGRYKITGKLGEGGFGITYSGTTPVKLTGNLGTSEGKVQVAIKEFFLAGKCQRGVDGLTVTVPLDDAREQVEKYKAKFRKEAENLSRIDHKHIVKVSEVFEENDTVYYVMSHLGGGSLARRIQYSPQKRLSEKEALQYARQIASALNYLHKNRICHLDVKPANILLNDEGEAVLIDFGISKSFGANDAPTTQSVIYSNHYAPLEQYSPITDFSPQTDIYSLSATLFFMVTGKLPPEASEVMNEGLPPRPDNVTVRTWEAIKAGMRPGRGDRPQTIKQWLELLDGNTGGGNAPTDSGSEENILSGGYDGQTVIGEDSAGETTGPRTNPAGKPTGATGGQIPRTGSYGTGTGGQTQGTSPTGNTTGTATGQKQGNGKSKTLPIYIFSTVGGLVLGAFILWLLTGPSFGSFSGKQSRKTYTVAQVMRELGRTDITIDSVEVFISCMDTSNAPQASIDSVNRRAYTMRQLLGPCFQNVPHKLSELKGIYVANDKYVSASQRQIFLWFFNRPTPQLKQWEKLNEPVSTLDDFKVKMDKQFRH